MVISPLQLWKDYDRLDSPILDSLVLTRECENYTAKYYYYNGTKSTLGCPRIFSKLYMPKAETKKVIMVMDDVENGVEGFDPIPFIARGWAVLVIDYAGENANFSRYTIYPKTLSFASYYLDEFDALSVPEDMKNTCWYIWATIAMRSVTFLEELGFSQIAFLGVGYGGAQVFKTAFFENTIICGAVLFSCDPNLDSKDAEISKSLLSFKAALGSESYACAIQSPIFVSITSNEQNSSLDMMNGIYNAIPATSSSLMSIYERANRVLNTEIFDNLSFWFQKNFDLVDAFSHEPVTKIRSSGGSLYIDIVVDRPELINEVNLFAAFSQKNSAYRNWRLIPSEKISENEYLSKLPVFSVTEPVYIFANVKYAIDNQIFTISSAVETVIPKSLGVSAQPFTFKRRVYDSEMGTTDWLVISDKDLSDNKLKMEAGPFGIEGVTSVLNSLSTFKLADIQFRGQKDSVLQILLYSDSDQEVNFFVKDSSLKTYFCKKLIYSNDNWTKFTLSCNDFKSSDGYLDDWDEVITFQIKSNSRLLVNSLLWV